MNGVAVGGPVSAILFNTRDTPDAFMTTLCGKLTAQSGQAKKAFRLALFSSESGGTKDAVRDWHSKLPDAFNNTPWTADRAIHWINQDRDKDKLCFT